LGGLGQPPRVGWPGAARGGLGRPGATPGVGQPVVACRSLRRSLGGLWQPVGGLGLESGPQGLDCKNGWRLEAGSYRLDASGWNARTTGGSRIRGVVRSVF